jgi:hypothetical protein
VNFLSESKDIADTNSKGKMFKIILFLSIIMTSIGIFLASYYSSINKVYDSYETILVTNINDINEINKNIGQFNSNQTIDVDYAKEQLPNIIKDLSNLRDAFINSKPSAKYKKDYENLKSGLDKNLLIYRQTLAILNNPSGADVETSMENLKTYRNDCMNFYSLIDTHNIKISLPETSLTFIDNVLNYSYSALRIRKETDIKAQQNLEFIDKIDSLSGDFIDAKTNFYSYVIKVRKKEMSYDDLLPLLNDNFTKLNKVQTNFKDLSIPPSAIPTYEAFKALLDVYESYLRDFKLALTSEKVQSLSAVVDLTTLDALYSSSNAKFGEVESFYNDFIKTYMELKNNK